MVPDFLKDLVVLVLKSCFSVVIVTVKFTEIKISKIERIIVKMKRNGLVGHAVIYLSCLHFFLP